MIEFKKNEDLLLLTYYPDNGTDWIYTLFKEGKPCKFKNTFTFFEKDIFENQEDNEDPDCITFIVAKLNDGYYEVNKDTLSIENRLFIHESAKFRDRMFVAYKNISVFRKFDRLVNEDIYIGENTGLPMNVFEALLAEFPNSTETSKYVDARISNILREHFERTTDAMADYRKYFKRRPASVRKSVVMKQFAEYERIKYSNVLEKLNYMLSHEAGYIETQWQNEILDIIQLLYPKYINVFKEVKVHDVYSSKDKRLDFMLVDAGGNIDIVEIKRPSDNSIVSTSLYRESHIPLRELSGAIMQAEKYIFYLNKWGKDGEDTLTRRYKEQLPDGLRLRIINPGAIIIMGRENCLSDEQRYDLEVIRRKYRNVVDIITYDELIRRLRNIMSKFTDK